MHISVAHSTVYHYDSPVRLEPHIFRLRPREEPAQRLLHYSIEIEPKPVGQSASLDLDGNGTWEAWFDGPVERLSVRTSFEVETLRDNPFDFVLTSESYDERLRAALASYLVEDNCPQIREISPNAAHPLDFLAMLNERLYRNFRHVTRDIGHPNPPEETLREGAGSCRDLAVLFCAACRVRGFAARFVSGYEQAAALNDGQMHAWAEVYLPGGGWRGYDPSRGLAVSLGHVAVAAAADPRFAAPVAGTYRGTARSTMEFAISMQANG